MRVSWNGCYSAQKLTEETLGSDYLGINYLSFPSFNFLICKMEMIVGELEYVIHVKELR